MDKRELTTFQEILLNYFQEEVIDRISAAGRIVDEAEILEIVQQAYDEMSDIVDAIKSGAISVDGFEPQECDLYH